MVSNLSVYWFCRPLLTTLVPMPQSPVGSHRLSVQAKEVLVLIMLVVWHPSSAPATLLAAIATFLSQTTRGRSASTQGQQVPSFLL